jgi:Ca-activated chloride channel family protein
MRPIAALLFVAFGAQAAAQQPSFKAAVELVTVPITVTNNDRSRLITGGLTAADFRLTEDGVPQTVTHFHQERLPVSLCIVVDASESMQEEMRHHVGVRALQYTVRGLAPDDEVSVVRFAKNVTTLMPWTSSPDPADLIWETELSDMTKPNTSLNDALAYALATIGEARNPRRAILLITDGFENASITPVSRVVATRQQSETSVYAMGLAANLPIPATAGRSGIFERSSPNMGKSNPAVGNGKPMVTLDVLPALVGDSGGTVMSIWSEANAAAAAKSLIDELRYQYTLGYTPVKPLDGKYRRLKVETTKRGIKVRHRGGYLALPSAGNP